MATTSENHYTIKECWCKVTRRQFVSRDVLTNKELNQMRDVVYDTFPDVCDIHTLEERVDALGSVIQYWTATYQDVPCRLISKFSGKESFSDLTVKGSATHIIKMPYDQVLTNKMRIYHQSITYEVIRVDRDTTDYMATYAELLRTEVVSPNLTPATSVPAPDPTPTVTPTSYGAFDESFDIDNSYD